MEEARHMLLALDLARKGLGTTSPNPMVGAVVVKAGKVVGKGYHRRAGEDHAEAMALREAGIRAKGATLYTTLEPCAHQGRTPPCVEHILKAGVREVVCAMRDPNPVVNGKGIAGLKQAGVKVKLGLLAGEATRLNEAYAKYITMRIPFVTLKTAMTLDGRIATGSGQSRWISGEEARRFAHELRRRADAVLVGIGTVLADDPQLTVRLVRKGIKQGPLRIILDSHLGTPLKAKVLQDQGQAKTIVVTTPPWGTSERARKIQDLGAQVWQVRKDAKGRVSFPELLKRLGQEEVTSLLIEGGSRVNAGALSAGVVDKIYAVIAPMVLGGGRNLPFVDDLGIAKLEGAVPLRELKATRIGQDVLIEGYVDKARRLGRKAS
jgi:diaminohydroxyphosphoribosylaminopyrimidine deaminase/5-amino-6-(5-phosphoribosylamino)uracil reductase